MPNNTGSSVINFGGNPGVNEASVVVTGQTEITALSKVEAYIMSDSTSDHSENDHRYVGLFLNLTCGTLVASTGFTIYAITSEKLTGQWNIRWVWTT